MSYALLPKQKQFLQSVSRLVVFMAGLGAGKSLIGAVWAILRAMKGRRVLVLEPTYAMCRDVMLPTLLEALAVMGFKEGTHYKVNSSTFTIKLGKGRILLRSAEACERLNQIGAELKANNYCFDQAEQEWIACQQ